MANIAPELSVLEPIKQGDFFVPNLWQKWYVHDRILGYLNMNLHEKKWIFKQSAAPTLATLAGAANGLRRGFAGINTKLNKLFLMF